MTVASTPRKAGPSQGNGVNTAFPFTFKIFSGSDILATYLDATGNELALTLGTDYTVALNADQNAAPGGTVTLLWTPASGTYITLTSQVTNTQNLALTNAGGFYPTSINDALDRIVIQVQQLAEQVARAAKAPLSGIGSLTPSSLVFGVDATGTPILSQLANISLSAVSTFMSTLLGLSSASAVKTALSVQSDLQTQANTAVLTTGTSTAYIAAPSPFIATPTANTRLRVKFHLASGVTPTLTVGSVTAALQQYDATGTLVAATLGSGQLTDVEYNGSVYVVLDPLGFTQTAGDIRYAKLAGLNTQQFNVADATAGNHAVAYDQVLGLGQTWQAFTVGTQRAFATTYYNTTGKPIVVNVTALGIIGGVTLYASINEGTAFPIANTSGGYSPTGHVIVPAGASYYMTGTGAAVSSATSWYELR